MAKKATGNASESRTGTVSASMDLRLLMILLHLFLLKSETELGRVFILWAAC
jgi:hypothetical protein